MSHISDVVRRSAALVIECQNVEAPDEVCEAIGRAIVANKPIICIVKPGVHVPAKFSVLVDRYVEWVDDQQALATVVMETIRDMGLLKGMGRLP